MERRRYERTPDTLVMMATIAVVGGVLTLLGEAPSSVNEVSPDWAALIWSSTFSAAAAVTLVGVLYRDPMTGWLLEIVGRSGLTLGALGYVAALAETSSGPRSFWAIAFVGGIGLSSAWRVRQLRIRLATLRAALKASQP